MARPGVEVVHVGSACRDVVAEDPRGWRLGGGVTYAALTTARLGLRTAAIVGRRRRGGHGERARPAARGRRRPPARAARRRPDLPQRRDAEGTRPDVRADRRPAARRRRCPSRGWPRRAGRWCRSPASSPTSGRTRSRRMPTSPSAWQGFLRELVAGEQVERRPPRAVARSCAGPTSSGSATTTSPARRPWPSSTASCVRAPTCSSPRAPRAAC